MKRPMLALIATTRTAKRLHPARGEEEYQLRHEYLVATKTTGEALAGADYILAVGTVQSGSSRRRLQIAAGMIEGKVDGVIFLQDELTAIRIRPISMRFTESQPSRCTSDCL